MVRLEALLLCDLIVPGPGGKLQIQGIFDTIYAAQFPAQHPALWVYFRFFAEENRANGGKHDLTFALRRPSNETEKLPNMEVQLGADGKVEGNMQLQGLPLHEEGEHHFEMYFDGELVGSYRFLAQKIPAQRKVKKETGHETIH